MLDEAWAHRPPGWGSASFALVGGLMRMSFHEGDTVGYASDGQPSMRATRGCDLPLNGVPTLATPVPRSHPACEPSAALCTRELHPNVWTGRQTRRAVAAMRRVCADCPAQPKCLEWALAHGEHGFWGGMTEGERELIRESTSAPLGTDA